MSDVDGIVEIGGRFLLLEWKTEGGSVETGQRIMFERMTAISHKWTVIVVHGDARLMEASGLQVFREGKAGPVEAVDITGLKARISRWADHASRARTRPSRLAQMEARA